MVIFLNSSQTHLSKTQNLSGLALIFKKRWLLVAQCHLVFPPQPRAGCLHPWEENQQGGQQVQPPQPRPEFISACSAAICQASGTGYVSLHLVWAEALLLLGVPARQR